MSLKLLLQQMVAFFIFFCIHMHPLMFLHSAPGHGLISSNINYSKILSPSRPSLVFCYRDMQNSVIVITLDIIRVVFFFFAYTFPSSFKQINSLNQKI